MAKYKTQKERLQAIVSAFGALHGSPFTMQAASEWAIHTGLWPVPTKTCTPDQADAWEEILARASKKE